MEYEITMPSPMEGSSREGDLVTVKHELKHGKFGRKPVVHLIARVYLFPSVPSCFGDTCDSHRINDSVLS